MKHPVIHTYFL